MQADQWARQIEQKGLGSAIFPFLETVRALGWVFAQALLLAQPLLSGLVDERVLARAYGWLEDPQSAEQLLRQLGAGGGEG